MKIMETLASKEEKDKRRMSPVTDALKTVLTSRQATHQVYSYRNDFKDLWKLEERVKWLTGEGATKRTLVVVWDETPDDPALYPVTVSDHLTAAAWAVAVALTAEKKAKDNNNWQIVIVDLASHNHAGVPEYEIFRRFQLGPTPAVPAIRILKPSEITGLDQFDASTSDPSAAASRASDLEILRSLWASALIQPGSEGDHHAIANLAGVEILLGASETQPGTMPPGRRALRALLDAVQLTATLDPKRTYSPVEIPKNTFTGFVLIDDMANIGWKDFLFRAGKFSKLVVWNTLGKVVEHIHKCIGANTTNHRFFVPDDAERSTPLWFLDLRLFSSGQRDSERKFYRDLLEQAEKVNKRPSLPWDKFTENELEAVKRYCNGSSQPETDDHFAAITLLPRLLSLVDPSLPVIIFSSTGQRGITERLRPYGNLILDFEKPRHFSGGMTDSVVQDTLDRLGRAVRKAEKIAKARRILAGLRPASGENKTGGQDLKHLEIYVEETKSAEDLAVVGLCIAYPNKDRATEFNKDISADFKWGYHRDDGTLNADGTKSLKIAVVLNKSEQGAKYKTIYNADNPYYNLIKNGVMPLLKSSDANVLATKLPASDPIQNNYVNIQQTILTQLANKLKELYTLSFGIAYERGSSPESHFGSHIATDIRYRKLSGYALETILHEILARLPKIKTINIFAGTRTVPKDRTKNAVGEEPETLVTNFGARLTEDDEYVELFGTGDAWPVVEEALSSRKPLPSSKRIGIARGVMLQYYVTLGNKQQIIDKKSTTPNFKCKGLSYSLGPADLPRTVHYAADYISETGEGCPEGWKKNGFFDQVNPCYLKILESLRSLDAGRKSEALAFWRAGMDYMPPAASGDGTLKEMARERLGKMIDDLSGQEFMEFTQCL